MIATIERPKGSVKVDLSKPIDISIPMKNGKDNVSAWYVDPIKIEPVRTDQFTGAVKEGGSVNFRNISFNPHGNGTHTECVGHIAKKVHSINQQLQQFFFWAELITVMPEKQANGDHCITAAQIAAARQQQDAEAIVIRTLPNEEEKKNKQYSNSNPPYLHHQAVREMVKSGINHLLIDLPSVDREEDEGKLAAHHAFWEHPQNTQMQRSITELIYVPNTVEDGSYLIEIQFAPFENDASPSRPVLYAFINANQGLDINKSLLI